MKTLAILAALFGVTLGLRYKVIVLVSAAVLVIAIDVVAAIISADSLAHLAITALVNIGVLELGYLCGLAIQHFFQVAPGAEEQLLPRRSLAEPTRERAIG